MNTASNTAAAVLVVLTYGCGVPDAMVKASKKGRTLAYANGVRPARFVANGREATATFLFQGERYDVRIENYGREEWHACGRASDGRPA